MYGSGSGSGFGSVPFPLLIKVLSGMKWCLQNRILTQNSGQCCGSGSEIRDPEPFWPLDPGSRIPNPYFWELSDNFLGKKFYNSLKIGPNFFLQHFKNKIVQFCEIYYFKKKVSQQIFFHPCLSLLFWDPGSEIWDPGSGMGKNQDPGSGINIPDPQDWFWQKLNFLDWR